MRTNPYADATTNIFTLAPMTKLEKSCNGRNMAIRDFSPRFSSRRRNHHPQEAVFSSPEGRSQNGQTRASRTWNVF